MNIVVVVPVNGNGHLLKMMKKNLMLLLDVVVMFQLKNRCHHIVCEMALSDLIPYATDALSKHHAHVNRFVHVSKFGENVYWITFIIFLVSTLIFAATTFQRPPAHRANGLITTLIALIATLSYYAMATGTGAVYSPITGEPHAYRQVYVARYIDWTFTTPLLLLDILIIAGISIGNTFWIVAADIVMIVTGLIAGLVPNNFKWGWYLFGCAALLVVAHGLLVIGRQGANNRSPKIGKLYSGLTGYLLVLWVVYPIVWALAEGTDRISSDKEALFYAVLDVSAKVVFGAAILHNNPTIQEQDEEESANGGGPSVLVQPVNAPLLGSETTEAAV